GGARGGGGAGGGEGWGGQERAGGRGPAGSGRVHFGERGQAQERAGDAARRAAGLEQVRGQHRDQERRANRKGVEAQEAHARSTRLMNRSFDKLRTSGPRSW